MKLDRHGFFARFGALLPPWHAMATTAVLILPVVGATVGAYVASGKPAALAVVFGFATLVAAARSLPTWPDYLLAGAVVVAGAVGAVLAAGHTGRVVVAVSAAALLQYPLNRRTVGAAALFPLLVFAVAGVSSADQPVLGVALWSAVGAALPWAMLRMAKATAPPAPLGRVAALRHSLLLTACCAGLTWYALDTHFVHGLWLILTLCLVFRPVPGETRRRAAERVIGTVSGAVFSGLLLAVASTAAALVLGVVCNVFSVAWSLKAAPYRNVAFWATPGALLIGGAGSAVDLALDRVAVTLAVAALAGVLATVFLPDPPETATPGEL